MYTKTGLDTEYSRIGFFNPENAERYKEYAAAHPDMNADEIVWRVNNNLDKEKYQFDVLVSGYDNPCIIVNKYFKLPEDYCPPDLVDADGFPMRKCTADAYIRMRDAARSEGFYINVVSAYRSIKEQKMMYDELLRDDPVSVVDETCARPCYSEHHTGLAVDVEGSIPGGRNISKTPEAAWLVENCFKFGFIIRYLPEIVEITGYASEPWHLRYVGVQVSTDMKERNIKSLEEYNERVLKTKKRSSKVEKIIHDMSKGKEVFFACDKKNCSEVLTQQDIDDAWDRVKRFASYVKAAFPSEKTADGIIDSPIEKIAATKAQLEKTEHVEIQGDLYVKRDDSLAVCGSLKARGGIYTVFKYAEDIAIKNGMLKKRDDYSILNNEEFKKLFSQYKISVGSTGNLGMSIGLAGSKLGFDVTVYMSEEAKPWKKNMLKKAGVNVIEFKGDYTSALKLAREDAAKDINTYFIDDEDSKELFLGYSVAYKTLIKQFEEEGIVVDKLHPLVVYLPCGVGGGPGGITFGLKQMFGDDVYCYFGEPTEMPCMALAMAKSRSDVSVYDIGLGNGTIADGLACSSPSVLAYNVMQGMLDGCFTVDDEHSLDLSKLLHETSGIKAEPSSCVALGGVGKVPYKIENIENATHLVWLTGGSLVPADEWIKIGLNL